MTSIYKEKVSSKLRLIPAEQMSLCNLIISRKKRDSNTGVFLWNLWNFKNSSGCFWKYVTYYYVIKYYLGHKLVIFNAVLFTLLHLSLIRWWDMRLKHDAASFWEEQADSRRVPKRKELLHTILSKNIYNNFQNWLLMKLLAQSGDQTDIFWKFYSPTDILWSPKTVGRVLGYTTALKS